MRKPGFTLLELILGLTLIAILTAALVPTTKVLVKRRKEVELKRALFEMRESIDRFKRDMDAGLIDAGDVEQLGYPADFDEMIRGVPLRKKGGKVMRYLRRVPVDPMTGEAEWGKRSVQDDPEARVWGHENLFDVYSLSDGVALDGTNYSEW